MKIATRYTGRLQFMMHMRNKYSMSDRCVRSVWLRLHQDVKSFDRSVSSCCQEVALFDCIKIQPLEASFLGRFTAYIAAD